MRSYVNEICDIDSVTGVPKSFDDFGYPAGKYQGFGFKTYKGSKVDEFKVLIEVNGQGSPHDASFYTMNEEEEQEVKDCVEKIHWKSCSYYEGKARDFFKEKRPFEYRFLQQVLLYQSNGCPSACTYFDKFCNKFVIEYNFEFVKELYCAQLRKSERSVEVIADREFYLTVAMIIEHETQHILRSHVKTKPEPGYDYELANLCQDLAINNDLRDTYQIGLPIGINRYLEVTGKMRRTVSLSTIWKIFYDRGSLKHTNGYKKKFNKGDEVTFCYYSRSSTGEKNLIDSFTDLKRYFEVEKVEGSCMDMGFTGTDGQGNMLGDSQSDDGSNNSKVTEESKRALTAVLQEVYDNGGSKGCSRSMNDLIGDIDRVYGSSAKNIIGWKQVLRREVIKGLSSKEKYLVNSPNARVEGQLGRDEDVPSIKNISFAIDMSGSMGIEQYQSCIDNIEGIIKAMGVKKLNIDVLWWGSSEVHETFNSFQAFKDRLKKRTPSLGGTCPELAVNHQNKMKKCDLRFVFTDGMFWGSDFKPKYRTIWCLTPNGTDNYIDKTCRNNVVVQFKNS